MSKIDYSWDETSSNIDLKELPDRSSLQIARRLFHAGCGILTATLYWLTFNHSQGVQILGTFACLLYLVEQIRISYPSLSQKFMPLMKFVMRAEEQLKESAMVPYAFAVLLTIITFPKPIAITSIYILAISDPLSAIVGIRFGKRKVSKHKSLEGSLAFFLSSFIITFFVLGQSLDLTTLKNFFLSLLIALGTSLFEIIPIKLDDNLTIPLFSAVLSWVLCLILGVHL